jgi:hypothetical protein
MKTLTPDQIADRKEKAARFVENVLDDPERAEEIRDESIESYAERRKFQIVENPNGGSMQKFVANPSKADVLEQFVQMRQERDELQRQNDELQQQLDAAKTVPTANPRRRTTPTPSNKDLLGTINTLAQENEALQDQLDEIADIATAPADDTRSEEDQMIERLDAIIDLAASESEDQMESGEDETELGEE